ncbi:zinc-dependent metalloprotease [Pengzhenrongella sicca]|uniref:Zinc-dependent metalloprotease n=1 Tax=Pengzhenrongella sicca TaxID=2819238 RepID=A0A8A4ZFS0_9MICO|nr:zinc-dependent metalloprotease [Pengzhenrongella sicca]QTE29783.1 zinc-dependent metalloprotease [Pengzhenrongella sicca]
MSSNPHADAAPDAAASAAVPSPVNWPLAARLAERLVRPGPESDRGEAIALVEGLRAAAAAAAGHVSRITGLVPADGSDPAVAGVSRVLVLDRPGWARANTEILAALTADVAIRPGGKVPSRATRAAGAAEAAGVLALLSGKVLGQFDPFSRRPEAGAGATVPGRLLLIAPNVLQVERDLNVVPADFRLWVALHEQTHALQFAAAPWLAEHLRERIGALLGDLTREQGGDAERVRAFVGLVARLVRGDDDGSGLDALLQPDERRVLAEVSAVMALLEGHADVAMDAVGRAVVPTVRQIRARFESRRSAPGRRGPADRVLRRLLGLDQKLAQYREGAAFVRAVTGAVGQDGLNAAWLEPANLPQSREIVDPRAWVRRVHG